MPVINPGPSIPGGKSSNPSKPSIPNAAAVLGGFKVLSERSELGCDIYDTTDGPVYQWSFFFGVDSSTMSPGARHFLPCIVHAEQMHNFHFDLVAHTSRSGSVQHNLGLAGRRLLAVQTMLTQSGVPAAMAYGAHHIPLGEEFSNLRGDKDGGENANLRSVSCFASASRETLLKYYFVAQRLTLGQISMWHRNGALS